MATPGFPVEQTACPSPHKARELLPLATFSHLTSLNQSWNRRLRPAGRGHMPVLGVGSGASPKEP